MCDITWFTCPYCGTQQQTAIRCPGGYPCPIPEIQIPTEPCTIAHSRCCACGRMSVNIPGAVFRPDMLRAEPSNLITPQTRRDGPQINMQGYMASPESHSFPHYYSQFGRGSVGDPPWQRQMPSGIGIPEIYIAPAESIVQRMDAERNALLDRLTQERSSRNGGMSDTAGAGVIDAWDELQRMLRGDRLP